MAGLQSGEDRIMIDSVVWAQYINVTDTQTDSHVAIANAAPTRQKCRQCTPVSLDEMMIQQQEIGQEMVTEDEGQFK